MNISSAFEEQGIDLHDMIAGVDEVFHLTYSDLAMFIESQSEVIQRGVAFDLSRTDPVGYLENLAHGMIEAIYA